MIIVFDFETIDTNENGVSAETAQPIQLAAVALDEKTLEIHSEEVFCSWINPGNHLTQESFLEEYSTVLNWHATNQNSTPEKLRDEWLSAPSTNEILDKFLKYCKQFGRTKPFAGGHNIGNFDLPILTRLLKDIKGSYPFQKQRIYDIRNYAEVWFEYSKKPPTANRRVSYSMDALRKKFKMSTDNAHDAKIDVLQESELLQRFLKLQKNLMNYGWKHRDQPAFQWAKVLN